MTRFVRLLDDVLDSLIIGTVVPSKNLAEIKYLRDEKVHKKFLQLTSLAHQRFWKNRMLKLHKFLIYFLELILLFLTEK